MVNTLLLLLPALLPSWRFFKTIEPSPRVEWAVAAPAHAPTDWRPLRPRPRRVSPLSMAGRMLWNPGWNEALFLVSCAERLMEGPDTHAHEEIFRRVRAEASGDARIARQDTLQFRLVFVSRLGPQIVREVTYQSEARPASGAA